MSTALENAVMFLLEYVARRGDGGDSSLAHRHLSLLAPAEESLPSHAAISLSPSTVEANSAFELTVNGSGFSPNSKVFWDGTPLPTKPVNANQLKASVSAKETAAAGGFTITVDSDGEMSLDAPFMVTEDK